MKEWILKNNFTQFKNLTISQIKEALTENPSKKVTYNLEISIRLSMRNLEANSNLISLISIKSIKVVLAPQLQSLLTLGKTFQLNSVTLNKPSYAHSNMPYLVPLSKLREEYWAISSKTTLLLAHFPYRE